MIHFYDIHRKSIYTQHAKYYFFTIHVCQVLDGASHLFEVDARTGVLRTKVTLDREQAAVHSVSVMAKNLANPYPDDSCVVMVTVEDVNDFPPVFLDGDNIELHVMENKAPSTLHKFVVSDLDAGPNADVEYSISMDENDANIADLFHIVARSGWLSFFVNW